MEFSFNPKGVCSKKMTVVVEDGKIASLKVEGGCDGNLKGISKLVVGMTPEECISRLDGIRCIVCKNEGKTQLYNKRGHLLSQHFPELDKIGERIKKDCFMWLSHVLKSSYGFCTTVRIRRLS